MACVLVVDDCPEDATIVAALLMRASLACDVVHVENGTAALDWLSTHDPTLVLLDLRLPDIDGVDVLARMKEDPRLQLVPVVVLAGEPTAEVVRSCTRQGAEAVVVKEATLGALAERLLPVVAPWLHGDRCES